MKGTLTSEFRKLGAARSNFIIVVAGVMFGLLGAFSYARPINEDPDPTTVATDVVRSWFVLLLIAAFLGALCVSREFSSGSVRRTVLAAGSRDRVLVAKLATVLVLGIAVGGTAVIGGLVTATAWPAAPLGVSSVARANATTAFGVFMCCVFAAVMGASIAVLVRSTAMSLAVVVGLTLFVEPGLQRIIPGFAKYLFTIALSGVYRDPHPGVLGQGVGFMVALGWVVFVAFAARRRFLKTDL